MEPNPESGGDSGLQAETVEYREEEGLQKRFMLEVQRRARVDLSVH